MKDVSIVLARVFAFISLEDMSTGGTFFYPDMVQPLVERYGFLQVPQKIEDFDETKGITFAHGRMGKVVIDSIKLYETGIAVDTTASTVTSEDILNDALNWATETFKLRYRPDMVKRKAYVSQLAFYSDAPLLRLNPVADKISSKLSAFTSSAFGAQLKYEPVIFTFQHDPLLVNPGPGIFTIQKREKHLFTDNKYFSASPTDTETHLALVEEIEKAAMG